jgi:hypothetical protein
MGEIVGSEVGELDVLEVAPDPLVRVEIRRIGREVLERDSTGMLGGEGSDGMGLVSVEVVPEQDDSTPDVSQEVSEEQQDPRGVDRTAAHEDVEASVVADPRDGRELRPRIAMYDDRGVPSRGPRADSGGDQAETGLVGEDQDRSLAAGFFLMRGQSFRSHRAMAASSRSRARDIGR